MTTKRNVLFAATLAIGCCTGLASAAPDVRIGPVGAPPDLDSRTTGQVRVGEPILAPEIDATSGVQAIALLSGILLLVGERTRRTKARKG
jgi:hypothetical protein